MNQDHKALNGRKSCIGLWPSTSANTHRHTEAAQEAYALQEDVKRAALEGHPQPIGWLPSPGENTGGGGGVRESFQHKLLASPSLCLVGLL